jgi:hypothetical protein
MDSKRYTSTSMESWRTATSCPNDMVSGYKHSRPNTTLVTRDTDTTLVTHDAYTIAKDDAHTTTVHNTNAQNDMVDSITTVHNANAQNDMVDSITTHISNA